MDDLKIGGPMPWSTKFLEPIVLKDGRAIATLDEARALMLSLPRQRQVRPYWQYLAELMLAVAEGRIRVEVAYNQLLRAIAAEGSLI
jgi:hypothetical protein